MHDRPFPSRDRVGKLLAMSPFPPEPERPTTTARTAQLRLRGLQLTAGVTWPTPQGQNVTPALVVLFPDPRFHPDGAEGTGIATSPRDAVVLSAPTRDAEEAWNVLAWAADHAAELGADPARLLVAGDSPLCAAVVARARANGWPPVGLAADGMFSTRQLYGAEEVSSRAVD